MQLHTEQSLLNVHGIARRHSGGSGRYNILRFLIRIAQRLVRLGAVVLKRRRDIREYNYLLNQSEHVLRDIGLHREDIWEARRKAQRSWFGGPAI